MEKQAWKMAGYDTLTQEDKLIWNLRDLGHTIRQLSEGKGSQKRILILLNRQGVMTQRALTERLGIQPGSASEVLGKLESAGLIERIPSTEDRRTTEICLTEAGRRSAQQAAGQRAQRHQQMFGCLTGEEKAALLTLTEKLNVSWEQLYGGLERPSARGAEKGRRHGKGREHDVEIH